MIDVRTSSASLRARRRRGTLNAVYAAVLDQITPGWSDTSAQRAQAADITALTAYIVRERHSDVPATHVEAGRAVGAYAARARARKRDGQLGADVIAELSRVRGWEWSAAEARWRRGIGHLLAWAKANRGTELTAATVHGDFPLGRWWAKTAEDAAAGRLGPRHAAEAAACWQAWAP